MARGIAGAERIVEVEGGSKVHGLLVRLRVRDFGAWRSAFDDQELARRAYGCLSGRIFRGLNEQDDIMVLLEWDDANRAWMFAQSDDLWMSLDATEGDDPPELWLFEDARRVHI